MIKSNGEKHWVWPEWSWGELVWWWTNQALMSVHQPQSKPYNITSNTLGACAFMTWYCHLKLWCSWLDCGCTKLLEKLELFNGRLCREVHWRCNRKINAQILWGAWTVNVPTMRGTCVDMTERTNCVGSFNVKFWSTSSIQALWVNIWSECKTYRLCGEQLNAQALWGAWMFDLNINVPELIHVHVVMHVILALLLIIL